MSQFVSGPPSIPDGADAMVTPPDVMREGLQSLAPQNDIHPVETIQKTYIHDQHALRTTLARHLYGQHFVDGLHTEQV